jgi:hypothetical protein
MLNGNQNERSAKPGFRFPVQTRYRAPTGSLQLVALFDLRMVSIAFFIAK